MASQATGPGQEGLQYLCTKYSSLISRLREEVLARQQAEGEARLYERRLREEASLREAERRQFDEERRGLREEIAALRTLQRETEGTRNDEAVQLRRSTATSRQLSARCDQLHEACAEEAHKALQVIDQAAAGGEVLIRQGEELFKLRRDHADCLVHSREASEELATCREHLARWRHSAGDLESKLGAAVSARDEAENRARHLQEEMRQALRSASAAKTREAATASCAGRGQRELRSREARLFAVRKEGQRFAQRASSAERRLRTAENFEVAAERMGLENRELRLRLEAEGRLLETARLQMARAEAAEARVSAGAGEFQSELRAKESLASSARQRVAELEGELSHARVRLEQLEGERTSSGSAVDSLRHELKASREEREESLRERDRAASELSESRRRVDRGAPQLIECRRRLQQAEENLAKASLETAEERRARERCHAEAIRAGEKLRASRAQSGQLRERVRALEELELRYPSTTSRLRGMEVTGTACTFAAPSPGSQRGFPAFGEAAWVTAMPPEPVGMALPLTPSPPRSPRCFSQPSAYVPHDSPLPSGAVEGEMNAVRDFVLREEQRLPAWGSPDIPCSGHPLLETRPAVQLLSPSGILEEPRPAIPAQSEVSPMQRAGYRQGSVATAMVGTDEAELAALLAAEPRVLKLPEPLRSVQSAEKSPVLAGDGE